MIFEVIALGIVSGLRPATSTAAVVALLRAPDARRLLLAYTVTGLLASVTVGVVIVIAFGGAGSAVGRKHFAAAVYLLAGVVMLGIAFAATRGRFHRRESRRSRSRVAERLSRPSATTAGVAGIATHIPGLLYLVVLNAIAAKQFGPALATAQIALYNGLWFALPLAALVLAVYSPATADRALGQATAWARARQDRLIAVVCSVLGVYLVLKGVYELP